MTNNRSNGFIIYHFGVSLCCLCNISNYGIVVQHARIIISVPLGIPVPVPRTGPRAAGTEFEWVGWSREYN